MTKSCQASVSTISVDLSFTGRTTPESGECIYIYICSPPPIIFLSSFCISPDSKSNQCRFVRRVVGVFVLVFDNTFWSRSISKTLNSGFMICFDPVLEAMRRVLYPWSRSSFISSDQCLLVTKLKDRRQGIFLECTRVDSSANQKV